MAANAEVPLSQVDPFSVDPVEKLFARAGLGLSSRTAVGLRAAGLAAVAWGPLWALAAKGGYLTSPNVAREAFLPDFSAHVQHLVGLPLLVIAERVMAPELPRVLETFRVSGLVREQDHGRFARAATRLQAAASWLWPQVLLALVALAFGIGWITGEASNGTSTWHALVREGREAATPAGLWNGLVAVPLFLFFVFRWAWRLLLWTWMLGQIASLKLEITAAHADGAGGIGFLGRTQARLGILVFAIGCVVAATIGYKLTIEEASLGATFVWVPVLGFLLLAPAAFVAPLLLFSGQLRDARESALSRYGMLHAQWLRRFEAECRSPGESGLPVDEPVDPGFLGELRGNYEAARNMRLLPFDLRSLSQVVVSAAGPFLPLLLKLLPASHPIREWLGMFL